MQAWEQIQVTIEYIEAHPDEAVDIAALARMASLSPFYYQRLFSRLVKKPVAEYVKLRRLAKAAEMLPNSDARLLDVALELGFSSQAHFTRAFKEAFGVTPGEYRKRPRALNRMTKPELALRYVVADEGVPLVTDGIILEIRRETLARPISFAGVTVSAPVTLLGELGCESGPDPLDDAWRRFHREKNALLGLPEAAEELGVAYAGDTPERFVYFAGGREDAETRTLPEGYSRWRLPEGEYAVCAFEAANFEALVMDALYKAQRYFYGWLERHSLRAEPFCAERYASHTPQTTAMELWLKLEQG